MVDVILLERVEKLGQMGQIVKVKPGFARNYLLPQKKAMRATKENMAYFDTQRAQLEANNLKRKGGRLHGRAEPDRPRPANQNLGHASRPRHAASRGRRHGDRQCRAVSGSSAAAGRGHQPLGNARGRRTGAARARRASRRAAIGMISAGAG